MDSCVFCQCLLLGYFAMCMTKMDDGTQMDYVFTSGGQCTSCSPASPQQTKISMLTSIGPFWAQSSQLLTVGTPTISSGLQAITVCILTVHPLTSFIALDLVYQDHFSSQTEGHD